MTDHKYILEPYKGAKTRYRCPNCGKSGKFSMYVNTETGEYLHPETGRYDREDNCGYHFTPKQYFEKFGSPEAEFKKMNFKHTKKPFKTNRHQRSFIPDFILKQSLTHYHDNNFAKFLIQLFGVEVASGLIQKYMIGTSNPDGTVFWYVNVNGEISYGRIMRYNIISSEASIIKFDCKRDHAVNDHCVSRIRRNLTKEGNPFPDWLAKYPESGMIDCFFGSHLLSGSHGSIGIVESEKTAIIASVYFPKFTWIATGSKGYLKPEKCKSLKGRNVTLFPDLCKDGKPFNENEWKIFADEMGFNVSYHLENIATEAERKQGLDLADFLIRTDYKDYQQPVDEPDQVAISEPQELIQLAINEPLPSVIFSTIWADQDQAPIPTPKGIERKTNVPGPEPEILSSEVVDLINFFKSCTIPVEAIKLNPCTTITNPKKFIHSHLETIRHNPGKYYFQPYLDRMYQVKEIINSIQNKAR